VGLRGRGAKPATHLDKIFDRVEIQTPDAREKCRFYSNLYRALVGRTTWSDVNGEWTDPDERPQKLTDPDAVMLGSGWRDDAPQQCSKSCVGFARARMFIGREYE
jgi:Glycosyl hydrolase family 92